MRNRKVTFLPNWCSWYSHRRIDKWTGGLGNKRTNEEHPNIYIVEINKNIEKSHGDFWRLAVIQTPVKNSEGYVVMDTKRSIIYTNTAN